MLSGLFFHVTVVLLVLAVLVLLVPMWRES